MILYLLIEFLYNLNNMKRNNFKYSINKYKTFKYSKY